MLIPRERHRLTFPPSAVDISEISTAEDRNRIQTRIKTLNYGSEHDKWRSRPLAGFIAASNVANGRERRFIAVVGQEQADAGLVRLADWSVTYLPPRAPGGGAGAKPARRFSSAA